MDDTTNPAEGATEGAEAPVVAPETTEEAPASTDAPTAE